MPSVIFLSYKIDSGCTIKLMYMTVFIEKRRSNKEIIFNHLNFTVVYIYEVALKKCFVALHECDDKKEFQKYFIHAINI